MASITRTNPATFGTDVNFLGKTLTHLDIAFGAAVNAKLGPASAVAKTFEALAGAGVNVVIIGPLHNTNANLSVAVEGEFGTDTYDGTNSETFAAYLQTELRLLTSVGAGSVNLSSATVGAQAL